jgi:hypothetical protein
MSNGMEETLAMRLGSGAHALLLDQPVAVFTGKVRSGKVWQEFQDEHAGKTILNRREHAQAEAMAEAVWGNREARHLIAADGVALEQRLEWLQQGVPCSGTPDARAGTFIADLKTTRCADPDRFARDATWRHYHAQLAWYLDGVRLSGLGKPTEAYVVAVESTPPHCVTVMRLTDRAIDQGRRLCRIWLERYIGCERDDYWPGYVESIVPFDVEEELELTFGDDEENP